MSSTGDNEEALEAFLRRVLGATKPGTDDFERGYRQGISDCARLVLATLEIRSRDEPLVDEPADMEPPPKPTMWSQSRNFGDWQGHQRSDKVIRVIPVLPDRENPGDGET